MTEPTFAVHTVESAPAASKPMLEGSQKKFGYIPAPVATMATSPELLGTFMKNIAAFDQTTLSQMEREVVVMTMVTHVQCHYCVAMHSTMLAAQQAPADLIDDLRERKPLADARLEAIRQFALTVSNNYGGVSTDDLDAFFAAGYTQQNALEVVLGIGTYTMSTFANRMTRAALDPAFEAYRWEGAVTSDS